MKPEYRAIIDISTSGIKRLRSMVESQDREFGKFKQKTQFKFNQFGGIDPKVKDRLPI